MFVTELDRPWLGTPFMLQGVLLEDERQIDQLRQFCRSVLIDRRRSVGDQFAEFPREKATTRFTAASSALQFAVEVLDASPDEGFLSLARRLRERRPLSPAPRARLPERDSQLEEELIYSAPIIDDVHRTLEYIRNGTDSAGNLDLKRVSGLVNEMAAGVQRNPDAMLWLTRLKITDQYSYDHAVDVSVHLMVFGRFLGLGSAAIEDLGQAGLMQDIGKVQIDPLILSKPAPLNDEEIRQMRLHVASSLVMLADQNVFLGSVLDTIAAHHERCDGSGYPNGLRGDRLSLHAEMAGLIDTYCAMTRHRVFKAAVSSQKALEALSRLRGSSFRDVLVDQFVQCVGLYPVGSLVELNTGEVAVVIQQNQVRRLRPRLLVLLAPDKSLERRPRNLELILNPMTPTGELYRIKHALPSNAYGIDPAEFYLN